MPIPAGNAGTSYATLEQLKVRLGAIDEAEDPALISALETASRGIEAFCGRQFFDLGAATPRLFHPGPHLALVDDFHATDGLVIETDHGRDGSFGTVWEARDYQVEPLNGVVDGQPGWPWWKIRAVGRHRFPLCWTAGPQALLRVTARWGWASIPSPVIESCLIIASETWKLKDAPLGVAGVAEFGVLRVRDSPMVATKLSPYQRNPLLVA